MREFKGLWFFYQKLIIPSLTISVLLALLSLKLVDFNVGIGFSYIILTPLFHYFIYEIQHPDEYYFYYNLGLSKGSLWICTFIISSLAGFIAIIL